MHTHTRMYALYIRAVWKTWILTTWEQQVAFVKPPQTWARAINSDFNQDAHVATAIAVALEQFSEMVHNGAE